MARCTHVKKARKKIPESKCGIEGGIKKGSSYYWWAFRTGRSSYKRYSLTPPKRSDLTQSSFYATLFDIEDDMIEAASVENIVECIEDVKSALEDLRDECQDNIDNLPESLQESSVNNERVEFLENAISEVENIDVDDDSTDEEKESAVEELRAVDLSGV